MLFRFDAQGAALISRNKTDHVFETPDWLVVVDATLPSSRKEELDHDAACLAAALDMGAVPERVQFEAAFGGHFAAIAWKKGSREVFVLRDVAGAKSIYLAANGEGTHYIGTNMHDAANAIGAGALNTTALRHLMTLDYLFDGETYYHAVDELPMGAVCKLVPGAPATLLARYTFELSEIENHQDINTNIRGLREEILRAHEKRAGEENVVLLSGGIDSSVMLCALREIAGRERVRAITFRVKGTEEDETRYAISLAKHLGVEVELTEVDPQNPKVFERFEEKLLEMNSPYFGRFVFGQFSGHPGQVYFAGQDTRLHTPDLNSVDKLAFGSLPIQRNPILRAGCKLLAKSSDMLSAFGAPSSNRRWLRGIYRAASALDLDRYLPRFFFKIDEDGLRESGYDENMIREALSRVSLPWRDATSKRHLYNMVVSVKWGEQYTDDMRYLQDVARANGTSMALPFYDIQLARFSSALPFEQASRFMVGRGKFDATRKVVNKFLLREAFRAELNDELYLRAKAVSRSQYLLFSGGLGRRVSQLLKEDQSRGEASLTKGLGMETLVARFLAMPGYKPEDEVFLTKVYWLAVSALIARGRTLA